MNLRRRSSGWGVFALLLVTLPLAGRAQFTLATNDNAITIMAYTGSGGVVIIPSATNGYPVTGIGPIVFYYNHKVTGVTIPDSVTSIGNSAFNNCNALTNVAMGNGVTNVGSYAFAYCSALTNIVMSSRLTKIEDYTFDYCSGLTNVVIPNGVASIGYEAFGFCSHLASVTIPNSVISLGDDAFCDCSALTNVMIPGSVASVGNFVFDGCYSLTNVTVGDGVTNLGIYAFANCHSLHQICFQGDAPRVNGASGSGAGTVFYSGTGTAYYLPGTKGWGATFGGWPTAGWYQPQPKILGSGCGLSMPGNCFHFTVSWATNTFVVVEASTNMLTWRPVITNALANGTNAFADSSWTNFPRRFYRVRSQ